MSAVYNSKNTVILVKKISIQDYYIQKPLVMIKYNKYMGGVDTNDQAAEIHIFQSEQSIKWRKKVFFRM